MEDLIEEIRQRTGLPTDTVVEVVTIVTEYVRRALPDDLVQQVAGHLGAAADSASGVADSTRTTATRASAAAASTASSLVDAATGAAATTVGMAKDVVNTVTQDDTER
jgi:hypothetical protein